jgi:hypothetical protein
MKRNVLLLTALLALAALTASAQAPSPLADLLTGKKAPLTIVLKDMGLTWRTFRVQDQALAGITDVVMAAMATQGVELASSEYYTKGDTLVVGTETYLIAYQTERKAVDVMQLGNIFNGYSGSGDEKEKPAPTFMTADTKFVLSLLNQRTMGNVMNVKQVNVEKMLADEAVRKTAWETKEQLARRERSRTNLQNLAGNIANGSRHSGNYKLPSMASIDTAMQNNNGYYGGYYGNNANMRLQPDTKEPYRTNPLLSGKDIRHISNTNEMILFYENTPQADGARYVAFLDGHVSLVTAEAWPMVKKISRLPEPANENLTQPVAPVAPVAVP